MQPIRTLDLRSSCPHGCSPPSFGGVRVACCFDWLWPPARSHSAETCVSRDAFGTSVDIEHAARIPGCASSCESLRPSSFVLTAPWATSAAHNWCELLRFPSPFVPGIVHCPSSQCSGTVPVVPTITLPARVALRPRSIFLSTGLSSLSTTNFFLLITFLALRLGDIWTWVTSLNTLFGFPSHSFLAPAAPSSIISPFDCPQRPQYQDYLSAKPLLDISLLDRVVGNSPSLLSVPLSDHFLRLPIIL